MAADSLRALLTNAIDYAGLFPPAELALETALENQAEYVRSPEAWMLGSFVLPIAKFSAAEAQLNLFAQTHPLRVSALGPKTGSAADFQKALEGAAKAIRFLADARPAVLVEQFEMPLPPGPLADSLGTGERILGGLGLKMFWETPAERAVETIATLAGGNSGFKLRSGGVTADAFPSSQQIAAALVASARNKVPIKFTAGLHHPVRHFHPSVNTKMHGFLNVLGAGVLAAEHSWEAVETEKMLNDEEASAFRFDDRAFRWRDWEIATGQIKVRRELVTSLGSCSFDEPRDDLREIGLL